MTDTQNRVRHTPGPWEVVRGGYVGGWHPEDEKPLVIQASKRCSVAVVNSNKGRIAGDSPEADANLIAAAPDLLKVCKSAHACVDAEILTGGNAEAWKPLRGQLESAIRKAEGDT